MSGTRKAEHVCLQVADRDTAVEFYQNVLGLAEIDRDEGVVYLGCGFDENFDLANRKDLSESNTSPCA